MVNAVIAKNKKGPKIRYITVGKVIDEGINDGNNMGAAMAPAAADTLFRHFCDTGRVPKDYDRIFSGDRSCVSENRYPELHYSSAKKFQ